MKKTTWPGRRASMAFGTALVLVAGSLALSGTSGASLSDSNFEIDSPSANLTVDHASPSIDWLTGGAGTAMRSDVSVKGDKPTGGNDDSFGGGAKEDTAVPTVGSGSIPPNKSDLKTFGVFKETNDAGSFLHLFWTRVQDPSGTTNMDFEFNHNQCEYELTGTPPVLTPTLVSVCSLNKVTPVRVDGDKLITYDLSNGGTTATIGMRVWAGSAWGVNVPLAGAVGTVNSSSTAIPATESGNLGSLSSRTFGEASIDLSSVFTPGTCDSLGSAYLKSRSSDAFSSALKDFIAPEAVTLSNCGSIDIHKQDDSGALLPVGVNFKLYADNYPFGGTAPHGDEDSLTALGCTTAVSTGNCTISRVPFGPYWVVETAPAPDGYTLAGDRLVNLTRGTGSTASLIFTDNRNPSALAIHKQDDTGAPLNGVTFTLYTDNAPFGPGTPEAPVVRGSTTADPINATLTCTTGLPAADVGPGDCVISGILIPGHYWVVESTPPTGYAPAADQAVNILAGSNTTTNSVTFINARTFKVIVLVCQESNSTLHPSAVTLAGATPGNSLSSAGATTAGLDSAAQAALCGLTAGAAGNKQVGTYAPSVVIAP